MQADVGIMGIGIILLMCGGPVVLLLVLLAATKGRHSSGPQAGPACPKCGGWTVPQANYCQWCGDALGDQGA